MTAKVLKVIVTVSIVLAVTAAPAFAAGTEAAAQETTSSVNLNPIIAVGAGLVTIGGALGIGKLAASAMEGTARQPEAGGAIRTSMIIAAALIEGFTFFALIVCMISKVA